MRIGKSSGHLLAENQKVYKKKNIAVLKRVILGCLQRVLEVN